MIWQDSQHFNANFKSVIRPGDRNHVCMSSRLSKTENISCVSTGKDERRSSFNFRGVFRETEQNTFSKVSMLRAILRTTGREEKAVIMIQHFLTSFCVWIASCLDSKVTKAKLIERKQVKLGMFGTQKF